MLERQQSVRNLPNYVLCGSEGKLVPSWAGILENAEIDEKMVKMKADLLSELVAVCPLISSSSYLRDGFCDRSLLCVVNSKKLQM